MIDWPVGLSTGCFFDQSIFGCLEPVRNAGFGIIEVCSFPRHLDYHDLQAVKKARALIDQLELEPYSMHAPFRDDIDISSLDDAKRQYALREVFQAVEAASALGVKYLVIHPGPERHDIPGEERLPRMDRAASSLNQVARRCREKRVGLVLENMLPHLFTGPVRELLWILSSMAELDVGVCLDTGHAFLAGDLYGIVHKLSGHLWMVHASDNHANGDDHLPPGQGKIDWEQLLPLLARNGFRGTLILEISGQKPPAEVLASAQHAGKFLREIARRIE